MGMSLTQRLFVSTSVVLGLFLVFAGLALDRAFTISLDSIVREKLRLHTYNILSLADNEGGVIKLPRLLAEKRFNTTGNSLLGLVSNVENGESWRPRGSGPTVARPGQGPDRPLLRGTLPASHADFIIRRSPN